MKKATFFMSLGLLMVCACAIAAGPSLPVFPSDSRRSVTVSGSGEVYAAPDRARLTMSVEVTRPALKDAQEEANRAVRDFLVRAHKLGCKDEDISTAALSIRSEYNYLNNNGSQTRQFVGYHVSRGIEIVVRDLDRVGDYLTQATDAGINNVSDPRLESSKADELRRQALASAALDARDKAQILASSLGAKLGTVHTIESGTAIAAPPSPRPMLTMARTVDGDGGNEDMGFVAGQIRFSASLSADFDLVAP